MESYFIKGIFIGLLFGIPIGAVGTMTVHRTIRYGFKAGLMTGLGSSTADCFYACVGVFGLTFISDFLLKHQMIIHLIGSSLILAMGIQLFICKRKLISLQSPKQVTDSIKMFLSSFVIGITNPAAILTFLFAFSYFGISGGKNLFLGIWLVCGVFIGTYIWWITLSAIVSIIKKKTETHSFRYMNKIFGTVLILFGMVVLIKTFHG
ncbi:MAG: LysE family transporter [Lachnospiraceae bacterium]|jgi:threonine/homoserine/homoserine lactone efflux protein|nr:LysE family transporter [Lachnospiraceae bacterium]